MVIVARELVVGAVLVDVVVVMTEVAVVEGERVVMYE